MYIGCHAASIQAPCSTNTIERTHRNIAIHTGGANVLVSSSATIMPLEAAPWGHGTNADHMRTYSEEPAATWKTAVS